jgi:hypothetical protein
LPKLVLAAKEQQLIAEANRNGVTSLIDGSGLQRMTNLCDERKIDKLINLVRALVMISIVIGILVFFG